MRVVTHHLELPNRFANPEERIWAAPHSRLRGKLLSICVPSQNFVFLFHAVLLFKYLGLHPPPAARSCSASIARKSIAWEILSITSRGRSFGSGSIVASKRISGSLRLR